MMTIWQSSSRVYPGTDPPGGLAAGCRSLAGILGMDDGGNRCTAVSAGTGYRCGTSAWQSADASSLSDTLQQGSAAAHSLSPTAIDRASGDARLVVVAEVAHELVHYFLLMKQRDWAYERF